MDSATRLYERLGEIPEDPDDPECLDDLLVCAFGAFERYYVCWKTKSGEFRQDGYDLPPDLKEWLFPTDGTTRDFPSLQVVFGRGEEYFASDKDGKLEFKEPEKKPEEEKVEKLPLRRSRTVSIFRPRSESTTKSVTAADDSTVGSRRSSNASSQPMSRPPSMTFQARPLSDASSGSQPASRPPSTSFSRPPSESSFASQPTSRTSSASLDPQRPASDFDLKQMDPVIEATVRESPVASPIAGPTRVTRRARPLSMSFNQYAFPKIAEESQPPVPERGASQIKDPGHCTCGCHNPPLPSAPKPSYRDSSMQTEPMSPAPRTAVPLRIDTANTQNWPSYSNSSSAEEIQTPLEEFPPSVVDNPLLVGRMMNFFSNPSYQLGDSLTNHYYYYPETQKGYQYDEEYIEETVHY